MHGLFVTATGTDVGKTYVTAGLLRAGRRAGLAMEALKPVLTGFRDGAAAESDAGQLLAAMGRDATPAAVARISPWRFVAPLAPNMAAAAEGRAVDVASLIATCRDALRPDALTLIEGIGGIMVPLDHRTTVLDIVGALGLPVLLVSGTALGAISHCLTAHAVLRAAGHAPRLVVLNESEDSTVPLAGMRETIAALTDDTPVTILRRHAEEDAFDALLEEVRAASETRQPPFRPPQTPA